ncbi:hypothetical protein, partial [Klebsiella pneumoniae]|uniref:hypothetical protein n=1 Tax=Klebsiella pneumoniae TaxID=573 RepID=UPI003B985AB1
TLERQLIDLSEAIKTGNKAAISSLMREPNVVAAVATAMQPHAAENILYSRVKPAELLQIFNDPEKLKQAEADARKYAQENFQQADNAVGKYL